jgi:hypothetical protein
MNASPEASPALCALCGSPLHGVDCPLCSLELRQTFAQADASSLPWAAMPPAGAGTPLQRQRLALSLSQAEWALADAQLAALVKTLRPLGAEGRRQLAATLAAWGQLKAAQGLAREADGLRQRAVTAAKDPHDLQRKQAAGQDGGGSWDNHAWVRLQAEEAGLTQPAVVQKVRDDLDAAERKQERRERGWKVAALAFAGALGTAAADLPVLAGMAVGALAGLWWSRRA